MYTGNVTNNYTVVNTLKAEKSIQDRLQEILRLPNLNYVYQLLDGSFKDGSKIFNIDEPTAWIEFIPLFFRFANNDVNKQCENFLHHVGNYINYDDFIFHQEDVLPATLTLENIQFFESGSASKLVGKPCKYCTKNTVFAQSTPYSRDEQPVTKYKCTAPSCGKDN